MSAFMKLYSFVLARVEDSKSERGLVAMEYVILAVLFAGLIAVGATAFLGRMNLEWGKLFPAAP